MAAMKLILCTLLICMSLAQYPRVEVSDWELQPYELPQDYAQGWETRSPNNFGPAVAGANIGSDGNIYYFGGLFADIPIRYFVDIPTYGRLTLSDRNPEWEYLGSLSQDDGFIEPHFTNGHNALKLDSEPDSIFLTCEDSAQGGLWRYDINNDLFHRIATMPIPLEDCCPVAIGDKIYIFGGDDNSGKVYNYTQIYDYHTNQWSVGSEIPIENGVDYHECEDVNDEFVYIFSGESRDNQVDLNVVPNLNGFKYDIINDKWTILENVFAEVPNYAQGVIFHSGVSYIPGTPYILITGGNKLDYSVNYDNAIIFNIDNDALDPIMSEAVNNMNLPRSEAVSVVVESYNKRDFKIVSVYTIGGRTQYQGPPEEYYTKTTEVIDFLIDYRDYGYGGDKWRVFDNGYDNGYYYPYYDPYHKEEKYKSGY